MGKEEEARVTFMVDNYRISTGMETFGMGFLVKDERSLPGHEGCPGC